METGPLTAWIVFSTLIFGILFGNPPVKDRWNQEDTADTNETSDTSDTSSFVEAVDTADTGFISTSDTSIDTNNTGS